MKAILAKFYIRLFQFVFLLLFLALGAVVFVWMYPNLVITPKTIEWLYQKQSSFVLEHGFPLDFEIDIQNQDFFKQDISIQASDFCFHLADQTLHACVKDFQLSLTVNFEGFSIQLISLGPIIVDTTSVTWKETEQSSKKAGKKQSEDEIKELLEKYVSRDLELGRLFLNLPNVVVHLSDQTIKGSVEIEGAPKDLQKQFHIKSHVRVTLENEPKAIELMVLADLDRDFNFNGDLDVKIGSDGPEISLKAKHKGNIFDAHVHLFGELRAKSVAPMISEIRISQFHFQKKNRMSLTGEIGIELALSDLKRATPTSLRALTFDTHLKGNFKITKDDNQAPLAFHVEIFPYEQYGAKGSAITKGKYHIDSKKLDLQTLIVSLSVTDFQQMVKKLHHTQMAIPAPINALQGSIAFKIGDDVQGISPFDLPIVLKTDLTSVNQSLGMEGLGNIKIDSKTFKSHLTLKLDLNDIALQLPALDPIRGLPNFTTDPRFVYSKNQKEEELLLGTNPKKEKKNKEDSSFTMDIQIQTPKKPIRLLYEHFSPYAQFRFTSNITEQKVDYAIVFEPFTVSYMKRDAQLTRFEIKNDPKTQELVLDGRFLIKKAGYDLYADINKEADETYIVLSSNPPLSEDDIISLILFNALSSELDGGSSDSVADTQTALTQKSIGFFSFFLLASTPVETVNYDPSTGTYSARVRLPGGFTGTVGSDWDKAQEVGLRRRLGGNWVISATVGTDVDGQSRQQSMVEWFYRY